MSQDNSLDFLTISGVSNLEQVTSNRAASDPKLWKPRVSAKQPNYDATVRLLPQGIEGLKNRTYPSVKVIYHHLRVGDFHQEIKCCRTLPGQQFCPVCKAIWDRYDEYVKMYGKDHAKTKAVASMGQRPEWFTNVLIRQDDRDPNNNGLVKVWRHTDAIERQLRAPFDESAEVKGTDAEQGGSSIRARKQKAKRHFYPHSPTDGVDFTVMVSWDPVKKMTTYDGSDYEEESSPLADTTDQMLEILGQCHDLTEYLKDVPTPDEAMKKYQDFLDEVNKRSVSKMNGNGGMGVQFVGAGAAPAQQAATVATNTVDANAYFGAAAQAAPAAAPAAAPVDSAVAAAQAIASAPSGDDLLLQAAATRKAAAAQAPAAQPQMDANELPPADDDDELPF